MVEFMLSVEMMTTNRTEANTTGSFPVDSIHQNSLFPRHISISPQLQVQGNILTLDRVKQIFLLVGCTVHFPPLQ